MNPHRMRLLKEGKAGSGPVVYWMSRDQRSVDNWALIFAQRQAGLRGKALVVVFCLVSRFLGATLRQYDFMLQGLRRVAAKMEAKDIHFELRIGSPEVQLPGMLRETDADVLVTDFDPLRMKRQWQERVVAAFAGTVYEVDAHNVIPCWFISPKKEYAARTFRPKYMRLLPNFLDTYPMLEKSSIQSASSPLQGWRSGAEEHLRVDRSVAPVGWIEPGEEAALAAMNRFLETRLRCYQKDRRDPIRQATSRLSPYLHFGMLSAQRVAVEVSQSYPDSEAADAFIEQLLVRRELADNFCYYEPDYDSYAGFPQWCQRTIQAHAGDRREHVYSRDELESGKTHDALWNAAQRRMISTGWLHGYMRMYWAKKILEWSPGIEAALATAIALNDRYQLDGRDPNGYTGIAWSLGGVHDRPWRERPIFGTRRYMSYEGAKRKFDVREFIAETKKAD